MVRAGELLDDVRAKMSQEAALRIGTDELVSAADEFQQKWRYGAEQIGKGVEATAEGLRRTHDAYASTEQAFTDALNKVGQSIAQPGAAAPGATIA
ncbi:hypothetical protein [Nocardia sp. BMG51109]|uniref:hypothetical protein n=1 Tax=Nocardia sp. BMG51109 TaxID=1056816 RepID=UPI0004B173C3|nr:hypothetical protein [Nocardia sp. BMG51109]